jgi:DNA replication protein DnaC
MDTTTELIEALGEPATDAEVAAYDAEQDQKRIDTLVRNTERGLNAPDHFTLESFRGTVPEIARQNYLISGAPNKGKTHLACSIARELARRGVASSILAYEPDVYISCRGQLGSTVYSIIDEYKHAPILVWDDLGQSMERPEQWFLNIVKSIFDHRAKHHKTNIVTCQYDLGKISDILGANLLRRILQKEAGNIRHVEVRL